MKKNSLAIIFLVLTVLPVFDLLGFNLALNLRPILIFAFLALGLHLIAGLTGILHLGLAGMMAIGSYAYSILCY